MARGNERRDIFVDSADRARFLRILDRVVDRMNVLCHAYCLMGNHYHLLIETPDGNLSPAIRQLNGTYAQSFNLRHDRVGHLFQGRFTSKLVEKDVYLLAVSRYIVLNPLRSGLVDRPEDWPWSSYAAHVGRVRPPTFLSVDWLLAQFDPIDRTRARQGYREFVLETPEPEPIPAAPVWGSSEFVQQVSKKTVDARSMKEIPRHDRLVGRPTLAQLFDGSMDRTKRNERVARAYLRHGYTMADIARHLGLSRMTISRAIRQCCNVRPDPYGEPKL